MKKFRRVAVAPNKYRISRCGTIQSFRHGIWRTMKPYAIPAGHLYVTLYIGKKRKKYYVHRLVLETFTGPCPKGKEARHFPDRDPENNNACNLSWTTHRQNMEDKKIHGSVPAVYNKGRI